jgi:hypothetical protein
MFVGRSVLALAIAITALASGCKEDGTTKFVPERQGSRGESCLITNDCKSGLLCIANTCIADDFALEATANVCVVASCVDNADCCRQSPSQVAACQELKQNCDEGLSQFYCDEYQEQCTAACTNTCVNYSCVSSTPVVPDCTTDDDCFGSRDKCVAGECVACAADAECGTGNVCIEGSCIAGCLRDEACGALSKCNMGRCEDRGCLDNRECVAFLERPDAVCDTTTGKCGIPCEDNAGCATLGGLYSCSNKVRGGRRSQRQQHPAPVPAAGGSRQGHVRRQPRILIR